MSHFRKSPGPRRRPVVTDSRSEPKRLARPCDVFHRHQTPYGSNPEMRRLSNYRLQVQRGIEPGRSTFDWSKTKLELSTTFTCDSLPLRRRAMSVEIRKSLSGW